MKHKLPSQQVLRIDPTVCEGIAMCAHLAVNTIDLDPWGYPIIPKDALTESQIKEAHKAVRGCPRKALFIEVREFGS
jgi:ferredoxin